jgi:hypothetical protein
MIRHILAATLGVALFAGCADVERGNIGIDRTPTPDGGGRPVPGADTGAGNTDAGDDSTSPDSGGGADGGDDTTSPDASTDGGEADATEADGAGTDTGAPVDPGPLRGPALGVDPTSVFWSYTGEVTSLEEIVTLRNTGDEALTVFSATIEGADPGFSVYGGPIDQVLVPGAEFGFGVRFRPPEGPNEASAQIRIEHSAEGSPLYVPIAASEKGGEPDPVEPPCVRVRPNTLDFGTVVRGTSVPVTRTFDIANCGTSEIRVQRLDRASVFFIPTPANYQWTSDPLPMAIAAGASRTVTVTYTAGRAGLQTGAIDVRTNVTGSETVRVNLRATSAPPPISELDLHLILRWDQPDGSDVDFHFRRNAGSGASCNDCYFANMTPDWGVAGDITDDPFLDYDDLEGPGPENINVDELTPGQYTIWVHYYSDTGSGGSGDVGGSGVPANATVEVYIGGVLQATYGPQRLGSTGASWDVATLDWPSGTLTPLGRTFSTGASGGCP